MSRITPRNDIDPCYDHFLVVGPHYWGRGWCIEIAIQNAAWLAPGDKVSIYKCSPTAYVDGMGNGYGIGEHLLDSVITPKGGIKLTPSTRN